MVVIDFKDSVLVGLTVEGISIVQIFDQALFNDNTLGANDREGQELKGSALAFKSTLG